MILKSISLLACLLCSQNAFGMQRVIDWRSIKTKQAFLGLLEVHFDAIKDAQERSAAIKACCASGEYRAIIQQMLEQTDFTQFVEEYTRDLDTPIVFEAAAAQTDAEAYNEAKAIADRVLAKYSDNPKRHVALFVAQSAMQQEHIPQSVISKVLWEAARENIVIDPVATQQAQEEMQHFLQQQIRTPGENQLPFL